ncbi:hypothetical protein HanHA300_Chr04g0134521 [Helianthus annuus]|nr:hypothetical protein HanHA300_Chr04g0134521 [Helianthus annuus]KAJ0596826.1 hypothetical protein HanHA89_Chr04g0147391 [Helianthus annuus]KAJ0757504.1 hypothetical protein HanLR1_Chr04g0139491 [Helianthus annuus]
MKPTRSFFSGDSILASFVYLKSSRFIIFFTHILLACFSMLRQGYFKLWNLFVFG